MTKVVDTTTSLNARERRAKDRTKIVEAVERLVQQAISEGKKTIVLSRFDFIEGLKLAAVTKRDAMLVVDDTTTLSEFHERFGEWLFAEYETGVYLLHNVGKPGEPLLIERKDDVLYASSRFKRRVAHDAADSRAEERGKQTLHARMQCLLWEDFTAACKQFDVECRTGLDRMDVIDKVMGKWEEDFVLEVVEHCELEGRRKRALGENKKAE